MVAEKRILYLYHPKHKEWAEEQMLRHSPVPIMETVGRACKHLPDERRVIWVALDRGFMVYVVGEMPDVG